MHNCKMTQNRLLDLALNEVAPAEATQLVEELNDCPVCREEYATLRNISRVSVQALLSALPTEDFWPGYHARLKATLTNDLSPVQPVRLSFEYVNEASSSRLWIILRKIATTSVRVPVPAALAMIVLVGIFFFALRSRGSASATLPPSSTSVETRTVEVPVIQEKVITQVVYVEKKGRRYKSARGLWDRAESKAAAKSLARTASDASLETATSLVGFLPTDRVKLTIIKGSYQDEK